MQVAKLDIHPQFHLDTTFNCKRYTEWEIVETLCGLESFQIFRDQLPPDLRRYDHSQVDTSKYKGIEMERLMGATSFIF